MHARKRPGRVRPTPERWLAIDETDERGERIVDDILLLLINGTDTVERFTLPGLPETPPWDVLLDTNMAEVEDNRSGLPGEVFELQPQTLVLLRQPRHALL